MILEFVFIIGFKFIYLLEMDIFYLIVRLVMIFFLKYIFEYCIFFFCIFIVFI